MAHNQITRFVDEFDFLSNFHPCRVVHGELLFRCAESAFQAAKSTDPKERILISNMEARESKRFGGNIAMRPDWDKIKLGVMRDILFSKFQINGDLWDKLAATGDAVLIEGNTWHDQFWGNCTCDKCKDTPGENHLGRILMEIRDTYRYYWRSYK